MPELNFHQAHELYIKAVVDAFTAAGVDVPDWHASGDDPRDAAIQLGDDTSEVEGPIREEWICWTEESGWFFGVDKDGRSGLNAIRWAHLGVLPEPAQVVEWVQSLAGKRVEFGEMDRSQYRYFDDEQDGFEDQLRAYVGQ